MKAKRRFNIWLWVLLCVPCLLASCDHDVHSDEEESGLSVSLTWADEADQGTEVKDVKLWIFNADDGSLVEEKHGGGAQEVASQRFALPEGHYQILNLLFAFIFYLVLWVTDDCLLSLLGELSPHLECHRYLFLWQ